MDWREEASKNLVESGTRYCNSQREKALQFVKENKGIYYTATKIERNAEGKIISIKDSNEVYIYLADDSGKLVFLMDDTYKVLFDDAFVFLRYPNRVATLNREYDALVAKRNNNLKVLQEIGTTETRFVGF